MGHPDKEFSYGKQSLEVDCFYSGPFFFLGSFQPQTTPEMQVKDRTGIKTEIRELCRGLSFLYVTRAVCKTFAPIKRSTERS